MNKKKEFWNGIESEFKLCCIIFFSDFYSEVRSKHIMFHAVLECYEYDSLDEYSNNDHYIRCPDCVLRILGNKK